MIVHIDELDAMPEVPWSNTRAEVPLKGCWLAGGIRCDGDRAARQVVLIVGVIVFATVSYSLKIVARHADDYIHRLSA